MDREFSSLIDESINIELNVADLYLLFKESFPEDADFWWQLSLEEHGHAALLRSGRDYFEPASRFPRDLLAEQLQSLRDTNSRVETLIREFKVTPPSRERAFGVAVETEELAGELHLQHFMDKESNSEIDEVFKKLNKDDRDHAVRLRSYAESHGIQLQSEDV